MLSVEGLGFRFCGFSSHVEGHKRHGKGNGNCVYPSGEECKATGNEM